MNDMVIIGGAGFLLTVIGIMAPVLKLNGAIVRLTTVVEQLEDLIKDKTDKLDARVTKHGQEIDDIRVKQAEQEQRIKVLER